MERFPEEENYYQQDMIKGGCRLLRLGEAGRNLPRR